MKLRTALKEMLADWPEDLPALHGDVLELLKRSQVAWCPTLSVRGAGLQTAPRARRARGASVSLHGRSLQPAHLVGAREGRRDE